MRKTNREIKDFNLICGILEKCQTARLGLFGDDYPYVVPLSYGYEAKDGKITIYFHCATEGKKISLIEKNNRACVELDVLNGYVDTGRSVTADYESVICFGKVYRCDGEEKIKGLRLLLEHTGYNSYSAEQCAAMPIVSVYKFQSDCFTGKSRFEKQYSE